jgi:hypothetical protein
MSETMTAYYNERTGHVIAAVTRAAGAGQASRKAPTEDSVLLRLLDGSDLLDFPVPGSELSTLVVDPLPAALLKPVSFHVPEKGGEVQPLPEATVTSIGLTPSEVTINVSPQAQAEESAWVLIFGGTLPVPRINSGVVPSGQSVAKLTIETLSPGTYRILALVRGRLPKAQSGTILPPPPPPPPPTP